MTTSDTKNSHDLAASLRELAYRLTAAPAFTLESNPFLFVNYWNKTNFIASAKVLGGTKEVDSYSFNLKRTWGALDVSLSAPRDTVCRIVTPAQEAVYDCEPLLTPAEEAQVTE